MTPMPPTCPREDAEQAAVSHFCLPWPPSANNFKAAVVVKGRVRFLLTKEARAYKAESAAIIAQTGCKPLDGPVYVRVAAYRPRRVGDLDNALKVVLDCLTGIAYTDDAQIVSLYALRFDDKANPRVEITVGRVSE